MTNALVSDPSPAGASPVRNPWRSILRNPLTLAATILLCMVALSAVLAPLLSQYDPIAIDPTSRLQGPSSEHWLGTDSFGRDMFTRVLYGARVSLIVGLGAAALSLFFGLIIGVVAGYFPVADAIVMRIMDGIMAIPSILLAIALISINGGSIVAVLVAITVPEIPRVVRLVRSVILKIRTEQYVEAAVTLGSPVPKILYKHMVPNTWAPLIVQGTFIFASAVLTEATLSFLGAGLPSEIPSWGNIMADGRMYFQLKPELILYPGIVLALTLLSVNILGDVSRDVLDPRMNKKT